ncbi:MAG: NADH-quinone oxidoreductase subunit NuoN [Alphaproteobacteria bacterium]|nr:NADH-quinone oxidoreductase subunit NuoN [Alphaproteobacteria bacterium]
MESRFDLAEFALITPELIVLGGALLLLLFGAFRGARATGGITLLAMAVMLAAVYYVWPSGEGEVTIFNDMLSINHFTQFVKSMVLVASTLVLGMSFDWLAIGPHKKFEYPVLVLLSTAGLLVLVSANDLLTLYLGLELSSLSLYVLAAYDRDNAVSSEAGVKYFVLGALASGMLLFGASLVYGYTGTTNFSAMVALFANTEEAQPSVAYGAVVGMVMLVVALSFKISAVPFHMWTPDVYQGAPTPVTMLFATAPKIAAMAIFIRLLMDPFANLLPDWQTILAIIAVASMAVGAFGAITQTSIKRLLAYGSIGHVGYMLIGLAAGTPEGIKGVLIYFALYLFMSVGTFGFVLFMRRAGEQVENISDLAGLSKTSPRGALFMLLMMFSMAGIPPFAGFYGKFFVFLSAIQSELYGLAVIGVLTSVVAAFYYLRIVKLMYFDEPVLGLERDVPLFSQAVLLICALVTALFFLYPAALLNAASRAAGVFS